MKDNLIMFGLTVAWAVLTWAMSMVLDNNTRISDIEKQLIYMEKNIDNSIKKDVYEVDKLLLYERLK